jgi:hypothetical protein
MRCRIALLGFAVFFPLSAETAGADNERIFTGQLHYVRGEGRIAYCFPEPTLTFRLANGILSNMSGTCSGPVRADGTFGTIQCNFSTYVAFPSAQVMADKIIFQTKRVRSGPTCYYEAELRPNK